MPLELSRSSENCIITSYKVTSNSKYAVYAEIDLDGSVQGSLRLFNIDKQKSIPFRLSLKLGLYEDKDYSILNRLELVEVPLISNNTVEKKSVLVITTGNAIQLVSLEQLFGLPETDEEIPTWYLANNKDRILSYVAKALKDGSVDIWFCTRLGTISTVKYSLRRRKFHSYRALVESSDDSLNYMSSGFDSATTWEDKVGPVKQVAMACFDNSIYWLDNGTLEKHNVTQSMNPEVENTLISVTFATVKRLRTTSLVYFCESITNLGCVLHKRNTRGDWDLVRIFERTTNCKETSPLVDCQMHFNGDSDLTIVSGSECGKVYKWKYNYKLDIEVESQVIEVAQETDIIHCIQLVEDYRAYFLCNRAELHYVDI
ncbi:HHR156Wp [Eremothecium sinecaudum]|uniref:HHR156Wp n=1 Tax=Eremothecium sinecaudum TaxID=45286 RepID=A0A0X8HWX2_9SACH|nr:HHR156Wp [Eremothecium sinecaudum]AMD22925.1 HHR156Wp [Eremothecium sinecaudum]